MGRWAQARRTGGGDNPLNFMTFAINVAAEHIQITFNEPIAATALDPGDFHTNPSGTAGLDMIQIADNRIDVEFVDPITTDASVTYDGTGQNLVTPQTIAQT